MRNIAFFAAFVCFNLAMAQPDSLFFKIQPKKYDGPQWKYKNNASLYLSEVAFVNWNSGGENSISALLGFEGSADYSDKYFTWKNNGLFRFGLNKQKDRELRKSDDLIELNSNIGYRPDSLSNWVYSAKLNFRTQMLNGYKYPNTSKPISRLFAPAYLFLGAGMEYGKNIDKLSFYVSPLTLKATFVLDNDLANAGAFGVSPAIYDDFGNIIVKGERVRKEIGLLLTNSYETEVVENINVKNEVSLYSDYAHNFGNVDIDWRLDFDFKVNNFIKATLGSHLRYDDDVKTTKPSAVEGETVEAGARVQWKQFLGIGFAVDF